MLKLFIVEERRYIDTDKEIVGCLKEGGGVEIQIKYLVVKIFGKEIIKFKLRF